MARLSDELKRFVVMELAVFRTPAEVAERVGEQFGVTLSARQVQEYDARRVHGRTLAKKWRELFEITRETFLRDAADIPIAHKTYRLRRLDVMVRRAEERGNLVLAAALLEQAAKETGRYYTNRREVTGRDGRDLPLSQAVIVLPEKEFLAEQGGEAEAVEHRGRGNGKAQR